MLNYQFRFLGTDSVTLGLEISRFIPEAEFVFAHQIELSGPWGVSSVRAESPEASF